MTMQIKVTLNAEGQLELITQDGDFATGKTTLEALLKALQAGGVDAQQTGQVETHNHATALTLLGEGTGRIHVNAHVTEDGPPHTH
jgi:hypothetical protein